MRLDSVFPKRVVTASPQCHLSRIAELMEEHGVGAVVITDDERPVGIVTDRDLALEVGSGRVTRSEPARDIMSSPVATIGCHEGILAATRRLCSGAMRRLPIVGGDGRIVALVSLDDLFILLGREVGNLTASVFSEIEAAK